MRPLALLVAVSVVIASFAPAQTRERWKPAATVVAQLDDYLQRCAAFGFTGSVLIAFGDEIVLAKGYGIADEKTGALCTPQTVFDLGSLSKQFTASTVLALAQAKVLSLDDPLTKYVEDVPADKRGITLRHLLSHTSGFPRGHHEIGSALGERDDFLRKMLALPLESKPGSQHSYSNIGYGLVAALVELATKQNFEDVVRERVFAPAGLENTDFRRAGRLDAARAARGVSERFDPPPPGSMLESDDSRFEGHGDEKPLATDGWYTWGLRGAGGVLSDVGDLWKWERALRGTTILNEASKRQLFTVVKGNYALGWYVLESPRKTPWIAHGGSTANGFDVYATRFPREEIFITVLGNISGVVPWINAHLAKVIFGEKLEMPPQAAALDAATLAAMAGEYIDESKHGTRWRVTSLDGVWAVEALDKPSFEFLTSADRRVDARLVESTRLALEGLARDDFAPIEALDSETRPLGFVRGWWSRMKAHHGAPKRVVVLGGVAADRAAPCTVGLVDFERGSELIRFLWSDKELSGLNIGAPYPSRVRFVPLSKTVAVSHDLVTGKTRATLRFDPKTNDLELEIAERRVRARRE